MLSLPAKPPCGGRSAPYKGVAQALCHVAKLLVARAFHLVFTAAGVTCDPTRHCRAKLPGPWEVLLSNRSIHPQSFNMAKVPPGRDGSPQRDLVLGRNSRDQLLIKDPLPTVPR